jgi:hypothetical protein
VQKAALVEMQQPAAANQKSAPENLPSIPHQKTLLSSFGDSFISSGKQGNGATVLWEGRDIVTRETCIPTSLNINNLGKAAVLHFVVFCDWGHAKPSLSSSHRLLIIHSQHSLDIDLPVLDLGLVSITVNNKILLFVSYPKV